MEERINRMLPRLNEMQCRQFLANEAISYGYGGVSKVSRISGVSRTTITRGVRELNGTESDNHDAASDNHKIRRAGGGRHRVEENDDTIVKAILDIVDAATYGNPMNVLSYTTESLRKIAEKLAEKGINVSHVTVGAILRDNGYSKQANQKMMQIGEPHPDRNAQFEYINQTAGEYIAQGVPVISVDTKKKENLGNFKNDGQEYRRKNDPRKVLDHDFQIKELGKIAPYGVYNVNNNVGFVNVGTNHDTSEFAVESISRWWETVGKHTYPNATTLYITADSGGSNGYRVRMWKYQLQEFATRTGLTVHVSHFPPGTSKWNKVEHRLFCYITSNWKSRPLVDVQTAVNLIGATTTSTGLKVICVQDDTEYELSKKVSDEDFNSINLETIAPFGAWNYLVKPN